MSVVFHKNVGRDIERYVQTVYIWDTKRNDTAFKKKKKYIYILSIKLIIGKSCLIQIYRKLELEKNYDFQKRKKQVSHYNYQDWRSLIGTFNTWYILIKHFSFSPMSILCLPSLKSLFQQPV